MKLQAIPFTNNLVAVFKISFSACIIGNQHRAVVKFYLKEGLQMTEIHSMKTLLVQFWSLRSGRESVQSETIEKVRDMNFEDRRLNVRKAAYQKSHRLHYGRGIQSLARWEPPILVIAFQRHIPNSA